MNAAAVAHNPAESIEARTLTDQLVAARSIAAEERLALGAGLTLDQARAVGILVSCQRQDDGLRWLLARDSEVDKLHTEISNKIAEYGRTETPAISRLIYREIMVLVERAGARSARIAAESREVLLGQVPAVARAA